MNFIIRFSGNKTNKKDSTIKKVRWEHEDPARTNDRSEIWNKSIRSRCLVNYLRNVDGERLLMIWLVNIFAFAHSRENKTEENFFCAEYFITNKHFLT